MTMQTGASLSDLAGLLDFLDARAVARLVCAEGRAFPSAGTAVWLWVRRHLPSSLGIPPTPPSADFLAPLALLRLLRRVHAVSTYAFDVRFDGERSGGDVYIPPGEPYASHWGATGGSMFGDRACEPQSVSYWECRGLSEGGYVGVSEVVAEGEPGFRYYGRCAEHLQRTLSLPTPACDHMPAVMYCEGGFVTTGSFRGPKPALPGGVELLHAAPFRESDRVGVFVDLLDGFLLFTLNGEPQAMRVPLRTDKRYVPVFTASTCYNLRLLPRAQPPWRGVYRLHELHRALLDRDGSDSSSST